MSRRVTEKETLDYYNDFLIDPGVVLQDDTIENAASGRLRAMHYGTGYYTVVNPITVGESEAGHPGVLKQTCDGVSSDNPTTWLKFGHQSKLKDFTRYTCTFRLGQLFAADEVGGLTLALQVDSVWGGVSLYTYRPVSYAYSTPGFAPIHTTDPQEWAAVNGRDAQVATWQPFIPLFAEDRDTYMLEWHNFDMRLDYEAATITFYIDGQLVGTFTDVPEVMWNHVAYPGVWYYDNVDSSYVLLDEIGWSTRKPLAQVDDERTELSETLRSGTTRRTNR